MVPSNLLIRVPLVLRSLSLLAILLQLSVGEIRAIEAVLRILFPGPTLRLPSRQYKSMASMLSMMSGTPTYHLCVEVLHG